MRDNELQLSTFAGGLAYLYKMKVGANGALEGDYWQGLAAHDKVVAHRNDAATLAGAGKQTALRDSTKPLDFTFAIIATTWASSFRRSWVDRSGVVRSIHTGFAGPATGRHYDEHVEEFRDEVERLLAGDGAH